jgi:hypothetical protein
MVGAERRPFIAKPLTMKGRKRTKMMKIKYPFHKKRRIRPSMILKLLKRSYH